MLVSRHIILGILLSIFLYFLFPNLGIFSISIIFLSSFLIDVDHYIYYVYKYKSLSLKKAYFFFLEIKKKWIAFSPAEKRQYQFLILLFHGVEFLFVLAVASFFSQIMLYIFIGSAFHLLVDWIELIYAKSPLYIKLSPIYVHITNKHKKKFF
jgi:hypothetical protein